MILEKNVRLKIERQCSSTIKEAAGLIEAA